MMRLIVAALLLSGCSASPFVDVRAGYQIDRWSDWVLQPEREWIGNERVRVNMITGLDWGNGVDCPYLDTMISGPYDQAFVGCSKQFGGDWYGSLQLMHQLDDRSSDFIQTDQKQWQGHNPFVHLRAGYDWGRVKCPQIATGKSLLQGAPFESEDMNPDLYWANVECEVRFWGKGE